MRKTSLAFVTSCICKTSGAEGEGDGKSGETTLGRAGGKRKEREERRCGRQPVSRHPRSSRRRPRSHAGWRRVAIGRPKARGADSIRTYLFSRRCTSVYGRSHSCSISARILVGSETGFEPIAADRGSGLPLSRSGSSRANHFKVGRGATGTRSRDDPSATSSASSRPSSSRGSTLGGEKKENGTTVVGTS